jgi:predicted phosphodiesterase
LIADAKNMGAQAVLYGHTHIADCHHDGDLWIINPGSCGSSAGSVALIETDGAAIHSCEILPLKDMEETL